MKKALALLGLFALVLTTSAARVAAAHELELTAQQLDSISSAVLEVRAFDLINWKVGDKLEDQVSMGMFGKIGTSTKTVTKDEGTSIWMEQVLEIKVANKKETVAAQINKADGKVLKIIRNGKEEAAPNDKIEIISQEYTTVKVPAGEFKVLHVVAKSKQVSKIEVWANPQALPIDGAAKQKMATQLGEITMELTSFGRGQ